MFVCTEQMNWYVPAASGWTSYALVSTPLKMSPVKIVVPAASLIATLCGMPASLLAKLIWKATSGATLSSVGVNAMFWAATSTTAVGVEALGAADGAPDGSAEADGAAEAEGAAEADGAAADPDGPADALASTEGIGVADGAGAYVQPGVFVAQAATARTMRPAASRRMDRIGGQDLEMARGTAIGMCCRNLPRPSGFDASASAKP